MLRMSPNNRVRSSGNGNRPNVLDMLRNAISAQFCRKNAILISLDYQTRNMNAREVPSEILEAGVHAFECPCRRTRGSNNEALLPGLVAHAVTTEYIDVVVVVEEPFDPFRTIRRYPLDPPVE